MAGSRENEIDSGSAPALSCVTRAEIEAMEKRERVKFVNSLPGFKMDDVEVLVTDDQLTLRGSRNAPAPEEGRALRRERAVGSFERTIGLPVSIDTERVEAKLTNGVLSITLPKAEAARPRKISVRALPDAS